METIVYLSIKNDYSIKIKESIEMFKNANIFVPSVVDISGAGIKCTVVNNTKRLQHKNKTKYYNFK